MNEQIIGYWTVSNHGGLSVIEVNDETMTVRWFDSEDTEECQIIHEVNTEEGEPEPCINYHGTLYFLSECMKV